MKPESYSSDPRGEWLNLTAAVETNRTSKLHHKQEEKSRASPSWICSEAAALHTLQGPILTNFSVDFSPKLHFITNMFKWFNEKQKIFTSENLKPGNDSEQSTFQLILDRLFRLINLWVVKFMTKHHIFLNSIFFYVPKVTKLVVFLYFGPDFLLLAVR